MFSNHRESLTEPAPAVTIHEVDHVQGTRRLLKTVRSEDTAKMWLRVHYGVTSFMKQRDSAAIWGTNPLIDDAKYVIFDSRKSAGLSV